MIYIHMYIEIIYTHRKLIMYTQSMYQQDRIGSGADSFGYHDYFTYSDILTPYYFVFKFKKNSIRLHVDISKTTGYLVSSVDPDLDVHCLVRHVYLNIQSRYGALESWFGTHYENTPFQIYKKISPPKTDNFQIKNSDIFHISAQNIDCGY